MSLRRQTISRCTTSGLILCGLISIASAAAEDGVAWTDAGACPEIAEHQQFLEEILTGNYAYELPDQCVTLPPGTVIRGPLERTRARYGDGEAHFVLIETSDGRQLWTLESWVKFDAEGVDLGAVLSAAAVAQLYHAYDALRDLESEGRAMEHLRGTADRKNLVLCGQEMRGHQDDLKALEPELAEVPTPYGPYLRTAAIDLSSCVSCLEDALERCDLAAEALDRIEVALGPSPGSNDNPLRAGFGEVTYPQLIEGTKVRPQFPNRARKAGVSGNVILEAAIQTDGTVGKVKVLRAPGANLGFEESAVEAVRQWRYRPAERNGQPVAVYFTIVLEFVLK